ncbi:MAG: bestrophin-like domain [Flavisolibacter sp.]
MNVFFQIPTYILFVIIFCLIFLSNWLGYRYKKNQIKRNPGQIDEKMGSIEGSMLGVMSLLLGFSFSLAVSKYEARRHLVVAEANDISTAILRCDMYPDSIRIPLRADFKEYVESRISYYDAGYEEDKILHELEKAEVISGRIWKRVALYSNDLEHRVRSQQMIPNLNDMIDIVTTRDALRISKVPPLVLWTLLILVLSAAFLLGTDYKGNKRNIMLLFGYAFVMTLTLNLINELNHPRQGLINLDGVEKKVEDLRKLF